MNIIIITKILFENKNKNRRLFDKSKKKLSIFFYNLKISNFLQCIMSNKSASSISTRNHSSVSKEQPCVTYMYIYMITVTQFWRIQLCDGCQRAYQSVLFAIILLNVACFHLAEFFFLCLTFIFHPTGAGFALLQVRLWSCGNVMHHVGPFDNI